VAEIGTLITSCATALKAGAEMLAKVRAARLSPEAQDLLAGASETGEFHALDIDQSQYLLISAGGMNFADPNDPQQCARYQQAFKSLCERGYIEHQSGTLFTLTPAGFQAARKLVGPEP
jgi:hypothetical protein